MELLVYALLSTLLFSCTLPDTELPLDACRARSMVDVLSSSCCTSTAPSAGTGAVCVLLLDALSGGTEVVPLRSGCDGAVLVFALVVAPALTAALSA